MMSSSRHDDKELTRDHIQALSSADQLAEFFTLLRYPADARMPMTADALSLNKTLANATRHFERLTDVDRGALQVYLFELTSVTVAHTRALARAFRTRAGNFLLVLTDDYRRIDFVLLERELPGQTETGPTRSGLIVRPRVLSVDRRDPDRVALRVLRRFTFTEYDTDGRPDPYAQYDKLGSAYTIAEWSEPLFNNRALFSDYYLNQRLPEPPALACGASVPEWDAEARNRAFRQIRGQFAQARRRFADQGAVVARRELIQPLLETLGFRLATGPGGDRPDFYLHVDGVEGKASAFLLAYPWNRYLDGKDGTRDDERPEENPGAQVVSLLEAGAAPWGIVTNGKLWRLYSARAHSRATNYYEIDLEETLASPDPGQAFRYFYLLFRADAFTPRERPVAGGVRELTFLDWLVEQSHTYARELGERLKERVFEQIFPHFAEGFIQNLGGPEVLLALPEGERQARLEAVYHGTLTFLYRLLFLLYAESRDLLPVREVRGYYQISLQRLKEQVAERAGPLEDQVAGRLDQAYTDDRTELYDHLLELFAIVDRGSAARNVPIYNGGLFITEPAPDETGPEARDARFLRETRIPDRYLALGLDRLARDVDPKRGDLGFIDYKSLGVRQLGSIYEGLLEFQVRVAPQKMAVVQGKRAEEILPYAEAKRKKRKILTTGRGTSAVERTLSKGTVYLENDRRERKATGSYYTPDYIVKYIVRHTVGPVLDEKLDDLGPRMREAERRFRAAVRRKQEMEGVTPDEPALLSSLAGDLLRDLFDVKVLDPAMGSGHFLVEAVDTITDRLVRFLDGYPFLGVFFAGMRRGILEEMERQRVTVDPARLTDVTLLKRHVLKRCIYGVDLNPMAVELAKVSLWLDCFTLGAPLSFLDHHLRPGNSLIGAMARDVEAEMSGPGPAGQMTFLTGPFVGLLRAAEIMRGISAIADVTLEQVQESGSLFEAFDAAATPYKRLLDVYVAQHFGVQHAADFLALYGPEAMEADPDELGEPYRGVVRQARALYREKRFFHWDLEFPEVFIDLERAAWKENGGFDAVVGNPPYERIQTIQTSDPRQAHYFAKHFETATGKYDIYVIFIEQAANVIGKNGEIGMILPHKFTQAHFGYGIRGFLHKNELLDQILSFGTNQVFSDATTYTCLLFLKVNSDDTWLYYEMPNVHSSTTKMQQLLFSVGDGELIPLSKGSYKAKAWILSDVETVRILEAMKAVGQPLKELVDGVYQGIVTGLNDAFILEIVPSRASAGNLRKVFSFHTNQVVEIESGILNPFVKGQGISRYRFVESNHFLLYPYQVTERGVILYDEETLRSEFPQAYEYLLGIREELESRGSERMDYESWYALWNPRNPRRFSRAKILAPDICYGGQMSISPDKRLLHSDTTYAILPNRSLKYGIYHLLAILNSQLLWFFLTQIGTPLRGGYYRYKTKYLERFLVRRIHFTTPQTERERLVADLVALYQRAVEVPGTSVSAATVPGTWKEHPLLAQIETLLPQDDEGQFLAFQPDATGAEEKSDVVHDLLAHLARQMIDMHKDKQARVQAFWQDLETAADPKAFDTLRNKGKWEQSLSKDPACRPYVDPESRSTRHLDESLGWDEDCFAAFAGMLAGRGGVTPSLLDVYREHHPPYQALVRRIAATDRLIDQVVYRLYGLTEEEIAVVEGDN